MAHSLGVCALVVLFTSAPSLMCSSWAALAKHLPIALPGAVKRFADVHVKANVLLQCHFSRRPLPSELRYVSADPVPTCEHASEWHSMCVCFLHPPRVTPVTDV